MKSGFTIKKRPARRARGYHHGDLRQSLIDAAARMAGKVGIELVTLRAVAKMAGVSHAAPYHHFKNKADLLYAVAEEGFERLDVQLAAMTSGPGRKKNRQRLQAMGQAYVQFAVKNPHYYRVMFRPELTRVDGTDPASARERAYQRLIEAVQAEMGETGAPSEECMVEVLRAWCTMHGLASLWMDGALAEDPPYCDWGITKTTTRLVEASAIGRKR